MDDGAMVVAITGAASGIGRAVASLAVASGARVVALDRDEVELARLRSDLGDAVHTVCGDATTVAANLAMAARGEQLGGIDALVCCVGVFDQYQRLSDLSVDSVDRAVTEILDVNVRTALLAVRSVLDQLHARRGSVILTLSGSAFHPQGGGVLYGASKWCLRGVMSHLAAELAPNVRVNAVAPGGTRRTAMAGLGSLGQRPTSDPVGRDQRLAAAAPLGVAPDADDVALSYGFLLGPGARTMSGRTLHPDGGLACVRGAPDAGQEGPFG